MCFLLLNIKRVGALKQLNVEYKQLLKLHLIHVPQFNSTTIPGIRHSIRSVQLPSNNFSLFTRKLSIMQPNQPNDIPNLLPLPRSI